MRAHITERPVPLEDKRADCPDALARVVMQCLEKDPAARPQSAADILHALDDARGSPLFPLVRRLKRPRTAAAVATVAAMIAVAALSARDGSARELSVAVLPFSTFGSDSAQQYIAEGLADELATALGKVDGIRVVSRTLSYRYTGPNIDAGEVGRTLAADYVLHGNVRQMGGRLRVSAQLTSAEDNREYWSENYGRDSANVFDMQNEITIGIARALSEELGREASVPATTSLGTADLEAYDLYLRGRFLLARRGPGVRQSIDRFEEAIARDSTFARAHAGLAVGLELLPYFSYVRAQDVRERAMASARRALALDSTLSEAYTALGLAHEHAYEWELAERAHRKAVELDPNDASASVQLGRLLTYTGRLRDARAEFERARALDPYSATASGWVARLRDLTGDLDEALVESRRALEIDSLNPPSLFSAVQSHLRKGDTVTARRLTNRLVTHVPSWRVAAGLLQALVGDREGAVQAIVDEERTARAEGREPRMLLLPFLGLGDTARVLAELERATDAGDFWPTYIPWSEAFADPLRGNPRFAAILKRVGLNVELFTSPLGGRSQ
jgi:serine/threonine-protein kinase